MGNSVANPDPAKAIVRAAECMRRLMETGLTYEDLQKPIDDPGIRKRIVRVWKGRDDMDLMEGDRRVYVSYVLPKFKKLNGTLFDWASNLWDGREWKRHHKCGDVGVDPRELDFKMKYFGSGMRDEEVIDWAEGIGYRVANHLELLAYAMANPDRQREFPYVGLGSFAKSDDGGYPCFATATVNDSGRGIYGVSAGHAPSPTNWPREYRYLLVRV